MSAPKMSFSEIVRIYQQPLYWYIRRIVLVHEDAEDILQETFIKAFRHLWSLRNQDALKPWLYRIATNEVNRHFKKHHDLLSLDDMAQLTLHASEPVEKERAAEVISSAVLKMTPLQRQVFSLKYYENLDYDQISRITGSSKNSLMVSYHEARKKIEKEIEK